VASLLFYVGPVRSHWTSPRSARKGRVCISRASRSKASSSRDRRDADVRPGITAVVGPNGSASRTSSTPSPGYSASRARKALRAARWKTSSSPVRPVARPSPGRGRPHHRQRRRRPRSTTPGHISRLMFRPARASTPSTARPAVSRRPETALDSDRARAARHRRPGFSSTRSVVGPEDRRGFHRGSGRRTEAPQAQGERRCEARRDAGQPHPADRLTGELRRQLKPLGKQAEIARRAA